MMGSPQVDLGLHSIGNRQRRQKDSLDRAKRSGAVALGNGAHCPLSDDGNMAVELPAA